MSKFDEVANLYEEKQSELFELVNQILFEDRSPTKKSKPVTITPPEFQIDSSWISDSANALNKNSYNKFLKVVKALGIKKSINSLPRFISEINALLSSPVNVDKHTQAISRMSVLRVLYNLVRADLASSAGYTFERFLALVFGGEVDTDTSEGIVDVNFASGGVSLKLLKKKKPTVKGSGKILQQSLENGKSVRYIVCLKPDMDSDFVLQFKEFIVTDMSQLPIKKDGRFEVSINKLKHTDIGSIDLRNVESISISTMEALNEKFNNLLLELQDLVEQVDDLMYTAGDDKATRTKASSAKDKAELTRQSAAKIEKSS